MELSLYRKYRPQTFAEIVGQDHVSQTLRNAVASDAVAHAYVFAGSRGTGKTSMAKILAKALNCTGDPALSERLTKPTVTPCGLCDSCRAIAASTAMDVIEMDAASNRGIDDIRELRDKVAYAPVNGRYKVYIIDEVHMLTKEAFNALLKTLEEPPPHVVFVLATTEAHKIPATILSRCQRFDFRRPRVHDIALVLSHVAAAETIEIDEPAILEIARHAEGGFRDAIGTLEKLSTFFGDAAITSREVLDVLGVIASELLFEIIDIVIDRDPAAALLFVQRLAERGTSYPQFIHDLLRHLRQIFLVQYLDDVSDDPGTMLALAQNLEIDEQLLDRLARQAHQLSGRELLRLIELLGRAQTEIRGGLDPRLQLEMALVRAARPEVDHSPDALEERLRRLESGSVPFAPAPVAPAARPAQPHDPAQAARAARLAKAVSSPAAPRPASPPAASTPPATPGGDAQAAGNDGDAPTTAPAAEAPQAAGDTTQQTAAAPAQTTGDEADRTVAGDDTAQPTPDDEAAQQAAGDEAAPGADDGTPTPGGADRVKRAWALVLQQTEAQNVGLYAAVKDARVRADGERLVVGLPSSLTFGKASTPENRALLTAIITRTTGDAPDLKFELEQAPAEPAAPKAPAPDAGLSIAQRIALVKREFDASDLSDDD
jgi:DNA polymerase III subunit gamma/tau